MVLSDLLDFFNFFMLFMTLAFFVVSLFKNMTIRHIVVFFGGSAFYFLALKRMFSTKFKIGLFVRMILMLLIIIFGILATANEITWELVYASLNFYCLFVFLSSDNDFSLSSRFYTWNGRVFVLIALILIILSQSSVAYIFEDGRFNGSLVLGMTNPNLTAMLISGVFSMLLINFNNMKYKPLIVVIMGYLFYLIWLTRARSSLLATIFLVVYTLFYKNKKMPLFVLMLIMMSPIIFIVIYLQLYSSGFEDFIFMGKDFFSGREDTFIAALDSLRTLPDYLFGNVGKTQFGNAHNAPLTIMRSVGLFGIMLFYWNFCKHLIHLNKMANSSTSRIAIICILGVCLQTSAEAAMFLGIFPTSAFMYFYFLLASNVVVQSDKDNDRVNGKVKILCRGN